MKDFIFKRLVNDAKDNIQHVNIPLNVLSEDMEEGEDRRRMVVFLGANFRGLPGADFKEIMRISNLCLDYIRRECSGYDLYYKPHPSETDEANFLDLSGFTVESKIVAELFYLKNAKRIKYVFSTCSFGNVKAYDMGLNSYTFMPLAIAAFDQKTKDGYLEIFGKMPPEFFIGDFSQPLKENRKKPENDGSLEANLRTLFDRGRGNVWLMFVDPCLLPSVVALTTIMKKIAPERTVNVVIPRHNRWNVVPLADITGYFDTVTFVPRVFYSLRPKKIFKAIKTAFMIKKMSIRPDDIIVELAGLSFAENCFASYFRDTTRVAIIEPSTFNLSCGEQVFSSSVFRTRPGATFFNWVLEPLLGIEPIKYLEHTKRIYNVFRYTRPMNDIFDYVWIYNH